jgi:uncharacterized protein YegL
MSLPGMRVVKDVTNHTLGMIAINDDNTAYVNSFILPKNTEIPCSEEKIFYHRVSKKNENMMEIFVTQGEHRSPGDISYLGKYVLHDIPYQQGGNAEIAVTYEYDLSGIVHVAASLKSREHLKVSKEELPDDIPARFMKVPELETIEYDQEFTTVYLAFDISGSMSGYPLDEAKKAARSFMANMDLAYTAVGIIAFSDCVRTYIKASQNEFDILRAIDDIECCETGVGNATHPFNEIYNLYKSTTDERKFAVVLADGVWSYQDEAINKAKRCHQNDIDIVAIGFGGADQRFLKAIASTDEGSIFTTTEGLVEVFSTIAQEIGTTAKHGGLRR